MAGDSLQVIENNGRRTKNRTRDRLHKQESPFGSSTNLNH